MSFVRLLKMVAVHDIQLNYLSPLEMIFLKEIMVTTVHKETFIESMMFSFLMTITVKTKSRAVTGGTRVMIGQDLAGIIVSGY